MLIEFFGDKNKIYKTINANEAVIYDVSIELYIIINIKEKNKFRLKYEINDINLHSLRIKKQK